MNKLKLYIFIAFIISFKGFSCLNGESKVLKNGIFIYQDHEGIVPNGHKFYEKNYSKVRKELKSLYEKTKNLDYLSDIGFLLIIEKKYNEALKIYFDIEKISPNRYSTSSNIGTIYELIGDNVNALKWIKNSYKINPKSHNESEWLHIKILEAKIDKNNELKSDFFIGTSFGNDSIPKSNLSSTERKKLIKALYFQLNERITFIKPKDDIIGILLFELANLAMIENNNSARRIYKMSLDYGNKTPLVILRHEICEKKYLKESFGINEKKPKKTKQRYEASETKILMIYILPILLLIIGIAFLVIKNRK